MTTSFISATLLTAGFALLANRHLLAGILAAEISLHDLGLTAQEEGMTWSGIALVAGFALVMTGLLRVIA